MRPLPHDFRSPFCVDDAGKIYAASGRGVSVFSPALVKVRDLSLGDRLPQEAFTLKLALDRKRSALDRRPIEQEGCNTSTTCARNSDNNCYCPDVVIGGEGCTGCFVKNGSPGCGTCSSGAAEIE